MKVFVTRDGCESAAITIWNASKPLLKSDGYFYPDYDKGDCMECGMDVWTPKEFKQDFGFTPRKGSCYQYNLTLTKI